MFGRGRKAGGKFNRGLRGFHGWNWRNSSAVPAADSEDTAQTDGVFCAGSAALAAKAGEFDQHFRGVSGVAVAKVDDGVMTTLKPSPPVWFAFTVLGFLGAGGNGRGDANAECGVGGGCNNEETKARRGDRRETGRSGTGKWGFAARERKDRKKGAGGGF